MRNLLTFLHSLDGELLHLSLMTFFELAELLEKALDDDLRRCIVGCLVKDRLKLYVLASSREL